MKMDSDYLNYLTSTKLNKVNDKNVKYVSNLKFDTENNFLNSIWMCGQNNTRQDKRSL